MTDLLARSKDIPIIFSGPMVRALFADRKTMTRRILKPQPEPFAIDVGKQCDVGLLHIEGDPRPRISLGHVLTKQEVRYAVGDRLWVRENFAYVGTCDPGFLTYQATYPADLAGYGLENVPATLKESGYKWTPCIHMPRKLSRLTLIVTDIKIERLADISDADAILEGCTARPTCHGFEQRYGGWSMDWSQVGQFSRHATGGPGPLQECDISLASARTAFLSFINRLHGGPKWNCNGTTPLADQNPYMVAITFRVIKTNIDAPEAKCAA